MAVDPSQLAPGPMPTAPGIPSAPGAPPAPAAPNPTTDPQQLSAILAAILHQGQVQFEQEQQAALGTAVTTLLAQVPNQAGEAASSLPGPPVPPPMPSDPNQQPGASGY